MNKVLIIDDDKELCVLIKRSVLSEDIEADFCNTGKEGLQKLKEKEYQLVILDVMMPGMDGFETLEEIRKENSLPILMFTSKNDSASKVRGLRAGADDYLTKPFDMDELIARIISLIRRYTRFNQTDGMTQQLEFDGLKICLLYTSACFPFRSSSRGSCCNTAIRMWKALELTVWKTYFQPVQTKTTDRTGKKS